MPYKKLLTIVTMMLMASTKVGAQQSVSVNELRTIESLITRKDCGELYAFLSANPHTVSGSDLLARELQGFVRNVERGTLDCFAAPTAQKSTPTAAAATRLY